MAVPLSVTAASCPGAGSPPLAAAVLAAVASHVHVQLGLSKRSPRQRTPPGCSSAQPSAWSAWVNAVQSTSVAASPSMQESGARCWQWAAGPQAVAEAGAVGAMSLEKGLARPALAPPVLHAAVLLLALVLGATTNSAGCSSCTLPSTATLFAPMACTGSYITRVNRQERTNNTPNRLRSPWPPGRWGAAGCGTEQMLALRAPGLPQHAARAVQRCGAGLQPAAASLCLLCVRCAVLRHCGLASMHLSTTHPPAESVQRACPCAVVLVCVRCSAVSPRLCGELQGPRPSQARGLRERPVCIDALNNIIQRLILRVYSTHLVVQSWSVTAHLGEVNLGSVEVWKECVLVWGA